MDGFVIDESAR